MTDIDLDACVTLAREAKERANKATPGPWRVARKEHYGTTVVGSGDIGVTVGFFGTNSSFGKDGAHCISADESDANAQLAAFAPALADAVLALAQQVRRLEFGPVMPRHASDGVCIAAMEAIRNSDGDKPWTRGRAVVMAIRAELLKEQATDDRLRSHHRPNPQ